MSISFEALLNKVDKDSDYVVTFHAFFDEHKKSWIVTTTIDYIKYLRTNVTFHPLVSTKRSVQKLLEESSCTCMITDNKSLVLYIPFYDEIIEILLERIDENYHESLLKEVKSLKLKIQDMTQETQSITEKLWDIEHKYDLLQEKNNRISKMFEYAVNFSPFIKSPTENNTIVLTLKGEFDNASSLSSFSSFSPPQISPIYMLTKLSPKNRILIRPITFDVAFKCNLQIQQLVNNNTLILDNNMQINSVDNLNIDSIFRKGEGISLHVLLNTVQNIYGLEFVNSSTEEVLYYSSCDSFNWSINITLKNTGKIKKFDMYKNGSEQISSVNYYNIVSNSRYNSEKSSSVTHKSLSYFEVKNLT